ncbi:unnamed protein product [Trichobilharzia regenti]|nr:unnamed protein product [Trichobilharzia regenti]
MTKKHGQMKQAVSKMVQKAMEYLETTPDEKTKLELIEALLSVTESDMLTAFTTQELLDWSEFCIRYESVLRTETDIFNNKVDPLESDKRWHDLHL